MTRKRDKWDVVLEQMFREGVEAGEWEVVERDTEGRPIRWRLTDLGEAQRQREEGRLQ
jgi:hypothetical protein